MLDFKILQFALVLLLGGVASAPLAQAQTTIIKANNQTSLITSSSWVGSPTISTTPTINNYIATWNSTDVTGGTVNMGNSIDFTGISFQNPGAAVTINAGSYLYTNGSGLDMSLATENLTINCFYCVNQGYSQTCTIATGRTLTLAASDLYMWDNTWTVNTVGTAQCIVDGAICWNSATNAGNGSIVKQGTGTMILAGYCYNLGPTSISAGTLQIGNGTTGEYLASPTVSNSGALVFDHTDALTYSGVISGTGSLTNLGGGELTLTSANIFSGVTTISGGSLQIGNGTTGEYFLSSTVSDSGTLIFNHADALTYAGVISGTGSLNKLGAGTLTLTGSNLYSGTTTISGGTLQIGNGTTGEYISSPTISDSGALVFNHADALAYSGTIGGNGSLTKLGAGTLTLSRSNTYTGVTNISGGTLVAALLATEGSGGGKASSVGESGNAATNLLIAGTLKFSGTGGQSTDRLFGIGSGFTLDASGPTATDTISFTNAGTLGFTATGAHTVVLQGTNTGGNTLASIIPDSSSPTSLTKSGAGTWVLSGANKFSGNTLVGGGSLVLGNALALQNSTFDTSGSGNLSFGSLAAATFGGIINGGSLALNNTTGGVALAVGNNGASTSFSGILSGSGSLIKIGSGALTLNGTSTYTGGTAISGGVLQFNTMNSLPSGSGNLTINAGGALAAIGAYPNVNAWLAGGAIAASSSGAIALTPSSSDAGVDFTTNGGYNSLSLGAAFGAVSFSGTVTPAANGYNFGGGGGTLTLQSAVQDAASESTAVRIVGPGTVVFAAAPTYSGNTIFAGGTLDLGGTILSTTANVSFQGGTVQDGTIINNSTLYDAQSGTAAASLTLAGSASLVKSGSGTFTLLGNAAYGGGTFINAGVLSFATGSLGSSTITFGGGTLQWNGNNSQDISGQVTSIAAGLAAMFDTNGNSVVFNTALSGFGGLTKLGAGTLTLNAANNYTGPTTLAAGVLQPGSAGVFGSSGLVVNGGSLQLNSVSASVVSLSGTSGQVQNAGLFPATLTVGSNNASTTFTGKLADGGPASLSLFKTGGGTLTLPGNNSFSGPTTVNAGVLQIGGSAAANGSIQGNILINPGATLQQLQANVISTTATITANGTYDMNNLQANIGYLSGNGSVINLGGGNLSLGLGSGLVQTFAGTISGSGGLVVSGSNAGSGTQVLSGTNSYTGATTISGGILQLGSPLAAQNSTLSLVGTGSSLTFAAGVTSPVLGGLTGGGKMTLLDAASNPVTVTVGANGANTLYAGPLSGGSGLIKTGSGVLTVTGSQNYSGATVINSGTLQLGPVGSLSGFGGVSTTGWTTNHSGTGAAISNSSSNVLTLMTSGGLNTANSIFYNTQLPVVGVPWTATFTYNDVTGGGADGGAFVLETSGANALGGNGGSKGVGGITPSAEIVWNIYSGNGTSKVDYLTGGGSSPTLSTTANGVNITTTNTPTSFTVGYNGGTTLNLSLSQGTNSWSNTYTNVNLGTALGNPATGLAYLGFTGGAGGSTATQQISNFSFAYGSQNLLPVNSLVEVNPGGTFDLNGNATQTIGSLSGSGTVTNSAASAAVLTLGNDGTSQTFSGAIIGNLSLTKVGSGVQTFAGNNAYSGATSVNAGTLVFTSQPANSPVSVANNAALSVQPQSGTFTLPSLTLNSGAAFNMLDGAIGTLSLGSGSLAIGGASPATLTFELGGSSADQITTGGSATVGSGGGVIAIAPLVAPATGTYPLITAAGGLTANFSLSPVNKITFANQAYPASLSLTSTSVQLVIGASAGISVAYWGGTADSTWSNSGNWFTDSDGTLAAGASPNSLTDVYFSTSGALNLGSNTVDQPFAINSLNFTAASGPVTISGGNSLTIGVGGITLASGGLAQTINVPLALSSSQTWTNNSAGTLAIGGNVNGNGWQLTVNGSGPVLLGGALSGTGTSLIKSGNGTLTLSTPNGYSGGTTLTAGVLSLGDNACLGSGGLAINGGSLEAATTLSGVANPVTVGGSAVLGGLNSFTLSGNFTNSLGNRTLTITDFAGSVVTISGNIYMSESQATGRSLSFNSGTANTALVLSGNISDSASGATTGTPGSLTIQPNDAGDSVLISGTNTYTGTTSLGGNALGIIIITNSAAFSTGAVVLDKTQIQTAANLALSNSFSTQGAGPQIFSGSSNLTINGSFTDNAASSTFQNNGSGLLTLAGNVYLSQTSSTGYTLTLGGSGETVVSGQVANFNGSGGSAGTLAFSGTNGILYLTGTNNSYSGPTDISAGTVNVAGLSNYGVNGSLGNRSPTAETSTGDGIGIHIGSGTSGATLQYTGSTVQSSNRQIRLSAANNTIDASGSLPTATMSFTYSGTNVNFWETGGTRSLTLTGSNTGDNVFAVNIQDQGASATSLVKSGAGTWIVTNGANGLALAGSSGQFTGFSGGTTINSGTLIAQNPGAIGEAGKALNLAGGTLDLQTDTSIFALNTTVSGNATILSDRLTPNTGGITQTLGKLSIGAETLSIAPGVNVGFGTPAVTFSGATTLTGGATLSPAAGAILTLGGSMSGTFGITMAGTGTLVLSSSNVYAGGTTVSAGTLQLGTPSALGSGGLTVNGGVVDLKSNGPTITSLSGPSGAITDSSIYGVTPLIVNQSTSTTFGGSFQIGPDGRQVSLLQEGAGSLTLSGVNTVGSATVQNTGTLQITGSMTAGNVNINAGAQLAGNGLISLGNGGTLYYASSAASNFAGTIVGSQGGIEVDSGSLTLSGTNSFAAGTAVVGGTLSLGVAGALPSGTAALVNGTLDLGSFNASTDTLNGTGTVDNLSGSGGNTLTIGSNGGSSTFSGVIQNTAGPLAVFKTGSGTFTLTASSSYAGGTTINAGMLVLANGGNGSALGSGTLTLNGGTLAAAARGGTIYGPVQAGSTAHTIAPGAGMATGYGTLNLNGGLSVNSNSTLLFNMSSSPSGGTGNNGLNIYAGDLINLGSSALTGSGASIALTAALTTMGDYRLIQGSNFGGANLSSFLLPTPPSGDTCSLSTAADSGYLDLVVGNAATFSGSAVWVSSSGTTWGNASNWVDGNGLNGVPGGPTRPVNTDTATFSGSSSITAITLDINPSLAALSFSNSNYSLSGGSLTLQSSSGTATVTVTSGTQAINSAVAIAAGNLVIVESGSGVLGISGNISDDNGQRSLTLAGDGSGQLILSGSDSYGGGTYVQSGTLIAASSGAIPAGSSLTVGSGAALILDSTAAAGLVAGSPIEASSREVVAVPEPGSVALLVAALWSAAIYFIAAFAGRRPLDCGGQHELL